MTGFPADGARGTRTPDLLGAIQCLRALRVVGARGLRGTAGVADVRSAAVSPSPAQACSLSVPSGPSPADARERLLELIAVLERLSGVRRPEPAHGWLFTPNPMLEDHKPVELLRGGDYRRVLGAIDALGEGVFV